MWFALLAEKVPPECFGGVARLFNTVKEIKADEENVIFLNGGDMFQGNVWYSQFKWRVIAQFTNYLNFTASVSISQEKGIKLNSIISCLLYSTWYKEFKFVVLLIAVSRKSWVWWQDIWIFTICWKYHVSYGVCELWFRKLPWASNSNQTLCNKRSWGTEDRNHRVFDHWHWGKCNATVILYINLNGYIYSADISNSIKN